MVGIQGGVMFLNCSLVTKCIPVMAAVLLLVPFTGCRTKQPESVSAETVRFTVLPPSVAAAPVAVNYSALGPANQGEELTLTGELRQSGSSFCIEMNTQSRSKVTFVIDSPAESDQLSGLVAWKKLTQLTGKTVTVTGILTDCSATWTKHMALVSVVAE